MRLFLHRLFLFRPYKPRNPLLRGLIGLIGLALLAVFVVVGLFVGLSMLLYAAVRRLLRPTSGPVAVATGDPNAIEGEYRVVDKQPSLRLH